MNADDLRRVQARSYVPRPEHMADDEAEARRLERALGDDVQEIEP
jgi:hypothetical protein